MAADSEGTWQIGIVTAADLAVSDFGQWSPTHDDPDDDKWITADSQLRPVSQRALKRGVIQLAAVCSGERQIAALDVLGDVACATVTATGAVSCGSVVMTEAATVPGGTPAAGTGTLWFRDDGVAVATNAAGVDVELGVTSELPTLCVGDPGTEAAGVTIGGVVYDAPLKVSNVAGGSDPLFILHQHSTTSGPVLAATRSRSDTDGHTVVQDTDGLLTIFAAGWDGTDYAFGGEMSFRVDGTPGAGDMPTMFQLKLSADGSESPTTRLEIAADGATTISGGLFLGGAAAADAPTAGDDLVIGDGVGDYGMTFFTGTSSIGGVYFTDTTGGAYQGSVTYSHTANALYFYAGSGYRALIRSDGFHPNTTATYDLGLTGTRWRSAYLSTALYMAGGVAADADANADDIVVGDGSATARGISLYSSFASALYFNDTAGGTQGGVVYLHSADRLTLRTGAVDRLKIEASGVTFTNASAVEVSLSRMAPVSGSTSNVRLPTTAPASIVEPVNGTEVVQFPDGSTTRADWYGVQIPWTYKGGGLTFRVWSSGDVSTSDGVRIGVQVLRTASGISLTTATGSTETNDTLTGPGVAGDLQSDDVVISHASLQSPDPGDMIRVRFIRYPANAADTYTGNYWVYQWQLIEA